MFGLALSRHLAGCQTDFLIYQAAVHRICDFPRRGIFVPPPPKKNLLDRIEWVYWSTAKDLDTANNVQVWNSVWSDTDIHGDHLRIFKSQDLQDVRKEEIGQKMEEEKSCSKLPEMARQFCYAIMDQHFLGLVLVLRFRGSPRSCSAREQGRPLLLRVYGPTQTVSCSAR